MNPLKLLLYASVGVPIVSARIENLGELQELVHVAINKGDFVQKVESVLNEKQSNIPHNTSLLERNSWDQRVRTILRLIDKKILEYPGR
jgi:hypothetical protein